MKIPQNMHPEKPTIYVRLGMVLDLNPQKNNLIQNSFIKKPTSSTTSEFHVSFTIKSKFQISILLMSNPISDLNIPNGLYASSKIAGTMHNVSSSAIYLGIQSCFGVHLDDLFCH